MVVAACQNSPMKRCASGAVALLLALGGCSWSGEADEQQLAVAKCGLPVEQELALADGQTWERSEVGVEPLGKGAYRVTGIVTIRTAGSAEITDRPFTCEVEPDSSDERGFRVLALDVGPAF